MDKKPINEILEDIPKSINDLEELPIYLLLIIIGAYVALGIGFFHFLLTITVRPSPFIVFQFFINMGFGFGLLVSYVNIIENLRIWSVLTIIFSFILISFGGIVGILAGLISLFGGGLALLKYLGKDINF
ncbi:MAG: hypothetical protein ACOC85_03180 [Thermoplasmatota archaeon]